MTTRRVVLPAGASETTKNECQRGMLVERSTLLECPVDRCIAEVMTPRLLVHVARPIVTFVPVSPPVFPSRWEEKEYVVALRLFGVVPFGQQTIALSIPRQSDICLELRDNGHSALIRQWDHLISIQGADKGTMYTDRVDVSAGLLTPFIWAFGWIFYRHRQRRWRQLASQGFSYEEPKRRERAK